MAYGRRRTYRRPRRRRGKFGYQKRQKARKRTIRKNVKQTVINAQTSVRAPKSRAVMFQDTRTYIVKDNSHAGLDPVPIARILQLNDPSHMWPTDIQGTWQPTDYGTKTDTMPGISDWVCNKDGTGTGQYRLAECKSTKVSVSAIWVDEDIGEDPAKSQAMSKLICRKVTKRDDALMYHGTTPSAVFNMDQLARFPYTRSCDLHGTPDPKGGTITTNYSFARMNSGTARASSNNFWLNEGPAEKDFLSIFIMPQNNNYAASTERCGHFRIQIAVTCLVNLSEPNTKNIGGEGSGMTMESVKRSAAAMLGGGGAGDDA